MLPEIGKGQVGNLWRIRYLGRRHHHPCPILHSPGNCQKWWKSSIFHKNYLKREKDHTITFHLYFSTIRLNLQSNYTFPINHLSSDVSPYFSFDYSLYCYVQDFEQYFIIDNNFTNIRSNIFVWEFILLYSECSWDLCWITCWLPIMLTEALSQKSSSEKMSFADENIYHWWCCFSSAFQPIFSIVFCINSDWPSEEWLALSRVSKSRLDISSYVLEMVFLPMLFIGEPQAPASLQQRGSLQARCSTYWSATEGAMMRSP